MNAGLAMLNIYTGDRQYIELPRRQTNTDMNTLTILACESYPLKQTLLFTYTLNLDSVESVGEMMFIILKKFLRKQSASKVSQTVCIHAMIDKHQAEIQIIRGQKSYG